MHLLHNSFTAPGAEYTACPFWFWNGDLEPVELLRQIGEMAAKGISAFVIHARVGLTVPYLSEPWFERVGLVLDEAAQRGMKVWIYDEDNWASGYAGGRVVARDPSFVGQNLTLERRYVEGPGTVQLDWADPAELRAVCAARLEHTASVPPDPLQFHRHDDTPPHWSSRAHYLHSYAAEAPTPIALHQTWWEVPPGRWCVMAARQQPTNWIAAYSNCVYVDLINGGATDRFIEVTHAEYQRRFAHHFGSTVLGFFIDEPGFYNNFWDRNVGSLTWTHDFAAQFAGRRGYDLLAWLPALWEDLGERTAQIRYDYWHTVAELLDERCFGKLARWCEAHGVMLTGHLEWEEWLFTMTRHSANPFSALAPFHVPGVDKIDQVTDKLSEKLVASVAHAHGRRRVLSETFALIGWKLAPPYMKRIIDYQFVRGVNWLSCHGFYYSIEDFRQRECPPSEFFQNPWWPHSKPLWDYIARLSSALSEGVHAAPVALYYPIEQAWTSMTPTAPQPVPQQGVWEAWQLPDSHLPVQRTDRALIQLGLCLLENQYDFDLVDHTVVARSLAVDGALCVGEERFPIIVVPPLDAIHSVALQRLLAVAASGGTLLFVERLPSVFVAEPAPQAWASLDAGLRTQSLPGFVGFGAGKIGFVPHGIGAAPQLLRSVCPPDVQIELGAEARMVVRDENRNGIGRETSISPLQAALKYHRRRLEQADLYFLVNESEHAYTARVTLVGGPMVERWEPLTGERYPLDATQVSHGQVQLALDFAPWQSLLLLAHADIGASTNLVRSTQTLVHELRSWYIDVGPLQWRDALLSWHVVGLAAFSGQGRYTTTFYLATMPEAGARLLLDLGEVFETAQVAINEVALAPLVWSPYRLDVTDYIRAGENTLCVEVANTNTNAFEGSERPSGMLGPVRLLRVE